VFHEWAWVYGGLCDVHGVRGIVVDDESGRVLYGVLRVF